MENNLNHIIVLIKKNIKLRNEIKSYIKKSFNINKFSDINGSDYPEIAKANAIRKEKDKYFIKDNYLNYELLQFLKEKFNFKEINDYKDYNEFINKIPELFFKIVEYYHFWRSFNVFLFIYFNNFKGWNFKDYILDVKQEDSKRDYFFVQDIFATALPFLKISKENLTQILYHMLSQAKEDGTFSLVRKSLQEYCTIHDKESKDLLEYQVNNRKKDFLINILLGISAIDFPAAFEYTKELLKDSYFKPLAVTSLGLYQYSHIKYINEILEIFKSIESDNEEVLSGLAIAYANLMYQPVLNTKKFNLIFTRIKDLLKRDIPEVHFNILNVISRKNDRLSKENKFILLMHYTKIDVKYKGITNLFPRVLLQIDNIAKIFSFVTEWILNHDIHFDKEIFSYLLTEVYKKYHSDYIRNYIGLIINKNGKVRFFANNNIRNIFLSEQNREIWEKEVNKLNLEMSKRFICSLFNGCYSDFDKQEERVKIALLLLKKRDRNIFNFLIKELINFTEDYLSLIKDTLEESLDSNDPFEKEFLSVFQKNYKKFIDFLKEKNKIKEFDPFQTQAIFINKFMELYNKIQGNEIQRNVEKESIFLQFCKKIPLGYGDSFENRTLSRIEGIIRFSRRYYIFPEYFDFIYRLNISKNWEE
jgi:hypothetical protein